MSAGCSGGVFIPGRALDLDGDGVLQGDGDCDDADPARFPGHPEICDGLDNDCDGLLDGADPELRDRDGDGADGCADCDDGDATIYPGAKELCDGRDSDCDGALPGDESDDDLDGVLPCAGDCGGADVAPGLPEICDGVDNDCDGLLDGEDPDVGDLDGDGFRACEDCDDGEAGRFPGAPEACDGKDTDCDGETPAVELDEDGDGWSACAGDCDDTTGSGATRFPGAPELCDGIDNDCDGDALDMADESDADGDGFRPCEGDCDDSAASGASTFPGAEEACDGADDDCDGDPLEAASEADADGDGVGACAGDCDDEDASRFPLAPELCNGVDDDCDGDPAEAAAELDADGDGVRGCAGDCEDSPASGAAVFPGAAEACNGVDDDCDGDAAEAAAELDADGDGVRACAGDCDESPFSGASVFPGAFELCNGVDDDCDGLVDGADADVPDADGDGHDLCADCDDSPASGATVFPGAAESCNGVDDDCDGFVDEPEPAALGAGILLGRGDGRLELWPLDSGGLLGAPLLIGGTMSAAAAWALPAADVDGDGAPELLRQAWAADPDFDALTAFGFDCSGTPAALLSSVPVAFDDLPGDSRIVSRGDLDGDGDTDLLAVDFGSAGGGLRSFLLSGSASTSVEAGVLAAAAAAANASPEFRWSLPRELLDLDGDGLVDLPSCGWDPDSPSNPSTCWFQPGNGDGSFDGGVPFLILAAPVDALAVGDFDGDGDADLLLGGSDAAPSSAGDPGALYRLDGDGEGAFSSPVEVLDLEPSFETGDGPGPGRVTAMAAAQLSGTAALDVAILRDGAVLSAERVLAVALGDGSGAFSMASEAAFTSTLPGPAGVEGIGVVP